MCGESMSHIDNKRTQNARTNRVMLAAKVCLSLGGAVKCDSES